MKPWNLLTGFKGTLYELFVLMQKFYPLPAKIAAVQRWLLARAASEREIFVCRKHDRLLPGEWVPGRGANSYLTTDNELATSIFGLSHTGKVAELISRPTLFAALEIRGVTLCWGFGKTAADRERVVRSHGDGGISLPRRPSGTGLYKPRGKEVLKLAHLTPAADGISAMPVSELERRRIRMFRSLNPLNMYPLPRAGNRFTHQAWLDGRTLDLKDKDLGETKHVLECLVALLEEMYDREAEADTFTAYGRAARLDLEGLDLPALRAESRKIQVAITPKEDARGGRSTPRGQAEALSYEAFKEEARARVQEHGRGPRDRFITGKICKGSAAAAELFVRLEGFDDDHAEFNTVYLVAKDTRISALAYFLHLDARYDGDHMAIFRPGESSTKRSLKPFLNHEESDLREAVIPHLGLHEREVRGWNVRATK